MKIREFIADSMNQIIEGAKDAKTFPAATVHFEIAVLPNGEVCQFPSPEISKITVDVYVNTTCRACPT